MTAGDQRVLFTKWEGTAWQETSRLLKDTVIRSFVKCGISLPISGSWNSEISIDGLPDYRMGESADIEEIEFFNWNKDVYLGDNQRKLHRVFNINFKKRSCW